MDDFPSIAKRTPGRRRLGVAWTLALVGWLGATGVALAAITAYSGKPGVAARAPTSWPEASRLPRTAGRSTLVMVAHTRCACTRASLHELERVMARASSRMDAVVVFVGPRETGVLDVRATARAIPGVRVVEDDVEARLFGAATSGQVLLYDPAGQLVFRGGITRSRGHEGDSVGGEAVRHLAAATEPSPAASAAAESDVFGCALFSADDAPDAADANHEAP